MNTEHFSDPLKEIIGLAHKIAQELGDEKISTIHLFLANCQTKYQNPVEFVFPDENALENFYFTRKQRQLSNLKNKQIELTLEAGLAIRKSYVMTKRINQKR